MADPNTELDPFTQVFDALWRMADASQPLQALVKSGNRVRFDVTRDRAPAKKDVLVADLPELRLMVVGSGQINLHANSSASMIGRTYSWWVATGDQRVNFALFPVEFALMSAMASWQTVLTACTWRGQHFVKESNLTSVTDRLARGDQERAILGWSSVWSVRVNMWFKTIDLLNFNLGQ